MTTGRFVASTLNGCVIDIAGRIFPDGFDTSPNAALCPSDLNSLSQYVKKARRFLVWSGASDQSIFTFPNVNLAFRAWHDWCHWYGQFNMDLAGEAQTCWMQQDMLRIYVNGSTTVETSAVKHWCAILDAEIIGQHHHKEQYGQFPVKQAQFDMAYIDNPILALSQQW